MYVFCVLFWICLDFFCFLAKSEEELLKNNLIASSINRITRFFMRRFKEIKDSVKGVFLKFIANTNISYKQSRCYFISLLFFQDLSRKR